MNKRTHCWRFGGCLTFIPWICSQSPMIHYFPRLSP
jgi:hypothetical protein